MEFWFPSQDEPALLDWWRPLLHVARRLREERVPWPVHLEEFMLMGRVDRGPNRPSIWEYKHHVSRGPIMADDSGQTYRWIEYTSGRIPGRFAEIPVRQAVWMARLPDWVEPIWFDEPPRRRRDVDIDLRDDAADDDEELTPYLATATAPPNARRRGLLHLVPSLEPEGA